MFWLLIISYFIVGLLSLILLFAWTCFEVEKNLKEVYRLRKEIFEIQMGKKDG
jgi:hypothetical protein